MQWDTLEVLTHADGREALDGGANTAWPTAGVAQARTYAPLALPLEVVPGLGGFSAQRAHVVERFVLSPAKDTWFAVRVRASGQCRGLFPLAFGTACSAGTCAATSPRPEALTNAVLIDADGSGAYDDFPLKPPAP